MRSVGWWKVVGLFAVAVSACASGSNPQSSSTSNPTKVTTSTSQTSTTASTSTAPARAPAAAWPTYYGDSSRAGATADGPSSPKSVRRVWMSPTLDGDVYAQPLVVGDRVVVATENDTLYALRASDGKILWTRHLGGPVDGSTLPCGNVNPVGITSTPVIDVKAERIYAVGMVTPAQHMLFDVDLATGRLVASTRVDVRGSDPTVQNQRAALTLSKGNVYVPFGGRFGDCGDYHGRVVAVAITRAGLGAVREYTLPTQGEGGFWSPPGAATASDGSLYLTSGNSSSSGNYDYGNSVVRIDRNLHLVDSFAPDNWQSLNQGDVDLGTTSPVLLPGNRVFQVGKAGVGYLLDRARLGGIGGALHSDKVCDGSAFGGVARNGNTLFVPCRNGIAQVIVQGNTFSVGWKSSTSTPGPPIVAANTVWVVATGSGDLVALDVATGAVPTSQHIGAVPSQFVSPAAASKRVFVAADRIVSAFGN